MLLPPKPMRALAARNRTIFLGASAIAATCGFGLGLGLRGTAPAAAGPAPAPPAPASLIGAPFAQFTSERNYLNGSAPAPPARAAPWPVMAVPAPIAQLCAVAPARAVHGDESVAVALAADGQLYLVWQGGSAAPLTGVTRLPTTGGARVGTFELPPAAAAATEGGGAFGVATCDTSGCAWYSCAATSGSTAACAPAVGFAPLTAALGSPVRHLVMHPRRGGELFVSLEAATAGAAGAGKSLLRRVTPDAAAPTVTPLGADVHGSAVTALALDTTAADADAAADALDLAVATDLAVYRGFNGSHFARHELVGGLIDAPATALAFVAGDDAQEADLWVGHEFCLNVVRGGGGGGGGSGGGGVERRRVDRVSGPQGLPLGNITALVAGAEPGTLWAGGRTGLALLRSRPAAGEDRWRFFGGDRWLAGDDAVGALAAASTAGPGSTLPTPAAWAATQGGLALLRSRSVLLSDAAAAYTDRATGALSRHGWIAAGRLARYGDTTDNRTALPDGGSLALHDGDNDGLWTAMFVAAQIFRFGATGAAQARALAWKHLGAVEFLHNVTNTTGFIARTAVRCGEPHQGGDGGICPGGAPNTCGWVNSSACYTGVDDAAATDADADADAGGGECCWTWKRDTSSDEVTAHFFVLALAHERLARTDAERARVARLVCSTAAYIVDGGYVFVDPVSGNGTSWAYWDPAQLNGVPGKPNERGQNSLELLSILAVAAKVCDGGGGGGGGGGGRFGAAFATMVREHGYDRNAVDALLTSPQGLAFFDFRLAFMAFYNLATAAPQLLVEQQQQQQQQQQQPSREGETEGVAAAAAAPAVIPLTVAEAAACRARLQASLRRYWDEPGASVTARNNRLVVYSVLGRIVFGSSSGGGGGGSGGGGDAEQGAQLSDETWQLRRYPAGPLVDWPAANSRRLDVRLQRDWATCPAGQCASNVVAAAVLPADEALTSGSSDFVTEAAMNSVDGGGGFTENAPNAWLLGYWMARFHGGTERA